MKAVLAPLQALGVFPKTIKPPKAQPTAQVDDAAAAVAAGDDQRKRRGGAGNLMFGEAGVEAPAGGGKQLTGQ